MRFPGRPELAQVSRVMTLGELTASIAHEVNQPLAAVVTNAQAGLRWLALETPRLDEARAAVERIVRDGNRASEVIQRIRALAKKNPTLMVWMDINEVIREAVLLVRREDFKPWSVAENRTRARVARGSWRSDSAALENLRESLGSTSGRATAT